MRLRKGYIIVSLMCVFAVIGLTACGKTAETTTVETVEGSETLEDEQETGSNQEADPVENSQREDTKGSEKKEISIYTINDDTLESEPVMVEVEEQLTAKTVVDAAVKSLEEHSLVIGIDSVEENEDTVIVNFKSDTAPVMNVGSSVEETILNCISDSLLDNVSACKKVIFRVEGGPYESGHLAFDLDEVYASE